MIEIFILRDIITHNHLWESLYDNTTGISIAEKISSGDTKYKENVNIADAKTKLLALNVNPVKVNYNDAKQVLLNIWKILNFLEEQNKDQCLVSNNTYVDYDGNQILFADVIKKM